MSRNEMMRLALGVLLLAAPMASRADDFFTPIFRGAVEKSIPLLQTSSESFSKQAGCVSCHHQALPAMTLAYARKHGFSTDAEKENSQNKVVMEMFEKARPLIMGAVKRDAKATAKLDFMVVDPPATVGYLLLGLREQKQKPVDTLTGLAQYLAMKQLPDGRWPINSPRPPLEGSEFSSTAIAIRVLQTYAPKESSSEIAKQIARGQNWLLTATPKTTEDKVFRILGLRWSNANPQTITRFASALLEEQNDDGGWSQNKGLASDSYATGQTLVALYEAGRLQPKDAPYNRGALFLAGNQKPDGSWQVAKRIAGFQPYFDSKYPHGTDQYISISGACWATMALSLTFPEVSEAKTHTASAR